MRIKILHILFIILFVLLGVCLYYLQIIKGPLYKDLSSRNSIRLLNIDAPRGVIYDRHRKKIAYNALSFGVFIVPQEAKDLDGEIRRLSEILEVPESLLKRNYKRNYQAPFAPCEVIRGISKRKAILVGELRLDIPGVLVKEIPLRNYPYGEALAHVLGYIGEIGKKELESLRSYGYNVKDLIGKTGIEKVADSSLRGKNGGMQIQVDNQGRQVEVLGLKKPERGGDVYLTVDAGLQLFLWKMMKGKKGAAVFMDPYSGEILALVSGPSYDPNDSLAKVLNDKDAPLLNRAIMGQYPPGSLFKIVIAVAGLESGKIQPGTTFVCKGKLDVGIDEFNCWNRDGHGPMDLENAIIESCNVYFYNVGMLVGLEKICEYACQFGFGKTTGIELLGEESGFVPSRAWKRMEEKQSWFAGDTVNLSIGQGYLLVTPLQVVRMIAIVANGGELVKPHVLTKVGTSNISRRARPIPPVQLKIKKEKIEAVRKAMRGVVEDLDGTGFRAWSNIVSISGKTGTVQIGGSLKTHAWFGGFAPSEKPEISFVIFLEHGGSGGDVAALIAKKAVEYWYRHR